MVEAASASVGAPVVIGRAMTDASRKQSLIANFINSVSVGMVMTSGGDCSVKRRHILKEVSLVSQGGTGGDSQWCRLLRSCLVVERKRRVLHLIKIYAET